MSVGVGATEREQGQIIRLSYNNDGSVVVEPEDEDRFVLTAQNAVQACQDHYRATEAVNAFRNDFVQPLFGWCMANQKRIRACYIPAPTEIVQVFMVGMSAKYDLALGADMAKLELGLAKEGWGVSILQLPNSEEDQLQTFFDTSGAIEVYAQRSPAPEQVSA